MNREKLAEIRERVDKATPGPWENHIDAFANCSTIGFGLQGKRDIKGIAYNMRSENADFIAHARQDVPLLLDYIAELESELAEAIKHENSGRKASRAVDVILSSLERRENMAD